MTEAIENVNHLNKKFYFKNYLHHMRINYNQKMSIFRYFLSSMNFSKRHFMPDINKAFYITIYIFLCIIETTVVLIIIKSSILSFFSFHLLSLSFNINV